MQKIDPEKWKDPRWQKLRLEILNRDKWACRNCGDKTTTLHVHHLTYLDDFVDPWEYPKPLLISLCEDCHSDAHDAPLYMPGQIHESIQMGILTTEKVRDIQDTFFDIQGWHKRLEGAWGPLV